MVTVFDDNYAQRIQTQFASRPSWSRPPIYEMATAPAREGQRLWLSAELAALTPEVRARFMTRLEARPSFLAAYNELAVSAIVRATGYDVVPEPSLSGLTPDFLVSHGENARTIVEVYTRHRSDTQLREEQRWKELAARGNQIPVPVGIVVRAHDDSAPAAPESGLGAALVQQLRNQLLSMPEPLGHVIVIGNYAFSVLHPLDGPTAVLSTPGATGWQDADQVLDAINEKVSKYADVAAEHNTNLMVVVAAELQSPFTEDLVRVALTGAQSIVATLDLFGPSNLGSHTVQLRQTNELVTFRPSVSAIGWLAAGIDVPGPLTVYPVASAERPLNWTATDRLQLGAIG